MIISSAPARARRFDALKRAGNFSRTVCFDNPRTAKTDQPRRFRATFRIAQQLQVWQRRRRKPESSMTEMNGRPLPSSWPMPALGLAIWHQREKALPAMRAATEAEKHTVGDIAAQRRLGAAYKRAPLRYHGTTHELNSKALRRMGLPLRAPCINHSAPSQPVSFCAAVNVLVLLASRNFQNGHRPSSSLASGGTTLLIEENINRRRALMRQVMRAFGAISRDFFPAPRADRARVRKRGICARRLAGTLASCLVLRTHSGG